jgi:hypothetical protein
VIFVIFVVFVIFVFNLLSRRFAASREFRLPS